MRSSVFLFLASMSFSLTTFATESTSNEHTIPRTPLQLTPINATANFSFQDGIPKQHGMISNERINFTNVSISPVDSKCFLLKNKTPRSFKGLEIFTAEYIGNTGKLDAFTNYTFCTQIEGKKIDIATFMLGELPNPKFNIQINGFWSDSNADYSYFTKKQKEQLTRTLVELRYMLNREEYQPALVARLQGDEAYAAKIMASFASTTKILRAFMLNCCAEGKAANDWFSVHTWRYEDDATNPLSVALAETALHEISHNLGYHDGTKGAYPIGYAAADVMAQYYQTGVLRKHQPIYE